jgi:hypothetical protein
MAIDSIIANVSTRVAGAIRDAARSTGASFEYLLTAARIESNLNPAAQATASSATGLYQFVDQTWLATLKSAGPAHGYGQYADAITQGPDGRYEVSDPNMRVAIMRLRNDPVVSATMAGAFTQTNAAQLASALGRQPSEGELYIAHFLGSEGASKLIGAMKSQPNANAAQLFPQAAAANPGIFVDKSGQPRSVSEVYTTLTGRFEVARATAFGGPALRGVQAAMPDPAGVAQAYAQATGRPLAIPVPMPAVPPDARPLFQSMFTDRGNRAVTQAVTNLWTPAGADTPAASNQPRPLNLFTDPPAGGAKPAGGKI